MTLKQTVLLSIAGSDSGAGAGIQADMKISASLGVYCTTAITAITAQNTCGILAIESVSPQLLDAQLQAIAEDFKIGAIKLGMLGNLENARVVHRFLSSFSEQPVIIDPVLRSTSGDSLIETPAQADDKTSRTSSGAGNPKSSMIAFYQEALFPLADLITPNLSEAAMILGVSEAKDGRDMETQAQALLRYGPKNVLLKGGHLESDSLTDVLVTPAGTKQYSHPRIDSNNTHGTGCNLSSAISALLCKGLTMTEAMPHAIEHVHQAISTNRDANLGRGHGPINPFFETAV